MDLHQIQEGLVHGSAAPSPKTTLMKHVSTLSVLRAQDAACGRFPLNPRGPTLA